MAIFRKALGRYGPVILPLLLSACALDTSNQALVDAYRLVGGETLRPRLDPAFRYLRVMHHGQEAFLILGYVDPSPSGPVQVWYSGDRNLLRLGDGRVAGASIRDAIDWSGVTFTNLPQWSALGEQAQFVRIRDVSPGYRYGLRDEIHIRRVAAPDDSDLAGIPAASLTWYEERVVGGADDGLAARYAVERAGTPQAGVVYGEQCLSRQYCLSWQVWPVPGGEAH